MHAMPGSAGRSMVLLGAAVAGAVAGALGGELLRRERADAPQSAAFERDTVESLRAITARLEGLQRSVERLHDRPVLPPDHAPVPLTEPIAAGVEARLAELATQLESIARRQDELVASRADAQGGPAVDPGAATAGRAEPLPDTLPEGPFDVARLDALRGVDMEQYTQEHLLWTYAQILEEYGRPTRVEPSPSRGGIKLIYVMPDGDEAYFWFHDGKLTMAFWS